MAILGGQLLSYAKWLPLIWLGLLIVYPLRKALVNGVKSGTDYCVKAIKKLTSDIKATHVFLVIIFIIAMLADWKMLYDGTSYLFSAGTAIGIATVLTLFEAAVSAIFGDPTGIGLKKKKQAILVRFFLIGLIFFVVIAKSYANVCNATNTVGVWFDHPDFWKNFIIFFLIYFGISTIEFLIGLAGAAEKTLQVIGTVATSLVWLLIGFFYAVFLILPEGLGVLAEKVYRSFKGWISEDEDLEDTKEKKGEKDEV
ncbi:hypothetical protein DRQ36_01690 [bacterium]|nr:MAG: hypothetical protein DRQ36_01690 [bacterium]